MSVKERIRRTSVTVEFEQIYLSSRSTSFAFCEECKRENAKLRLVDGIAMLRGVLEKLEATLDGQGDAEICLFCLCSRLLEANNDTKQKQIEKSASK